MSDSNDAKQIPPLDPPSTIEFIRDVVPVRADEAIGDLDAERAFAVAMGVVSTVASWPIGGRLEGEDPRRIDRVRSMATAMVLAAQELAEREAPGARKAAEEFVRNYKPGPK